MMLLQQTVLVGGLIGWGIYMIYRTGRRARYLPPGNIDRNVLQYGIKLTFHLTSGFSYAAFFTSEAVKQFYEVGT